MYDHKIEEGINYQLEKFDGKTKAKSRVVVIGSTHFVVTVFLVFCFQ